MFDETAEPQRGRQGSSRQGWSKVNVRAIIYDLRKEHKKASHERLVRLAYERSCADEDVGMSAFDWMVCLCEESWRRNEGQAKPQPGVKNRAEAEASRQKREEEISTTVDWIREQFLLLNWEMPNGERLRFCTGTYVAKLGGVLGKAGEKAGSKQMGQVFDEAALREYVAIEAAGGLSQYDK